MQHCKRRDWMLTYDIARQRLFGTIGKEEFNLYACSGGGRGSKVHPYGDPNDKGSTKGFGSWNFRRQESGQVRGGPIPPGFYVIHKPVPHPPLGLAAYLEQTLTSLV